MKISDITIQDLMTYAHEDNVDDLEVIKAFTIILAACKAYIKGYTGLDDATMDTLEDLTIVLMVLANEMYDNRTFTVQDDKVNKVVKSILDLHCINLL